MLALGVCGAGRFPVVRFSAAAYWLCKDICRCVERDFSVTVGLCCVLCG